MSTVVREGRAPDPDRARDATVEVQQRASAEPLTCPLCRDALEPELHTCAGCQTTYHQDCTVELGGCSTLGCRLRGSAPRPARRRRRRRRARRPTGPSPEVVVEQVQAELRTRDGGLRRFARAHPFVVFALSLFLGLVAMRGAAWVHIRLSSPQALVADELCSRSVGQVELAKAELLRRGAESVPALDRLIATGLPYQKRLAAELLARCGPEGQATLIRGVRGHHFANARLAAVEGLRRLPPSPEVTQALEHAQQDAHPQVSREAARQLARFGDAAS